MSPFARDPHVTLPLCSCLLLLGCLGSTQRDSDAGTGRDGGSTIDDDFTVHVDDSFDTLPGPGFTPCEAHGACVLVEAGCDGCCQRSAIQAGLEESYDDALTSACRAADAPVSFCNCAYPDLVPRCVDGHCAAVARGDLTDTCFSPERPGGAGDAGAVGCACTGGDGEVCAEGTVLTCERDDLTASSAWVVVQDATCSGPDPRSCQALSDAIADELAALRSCESPADCGQRLASHSCGCTRNPVGRRDGDPTEYEALLAELSSRADEPGCEIGGSTCDCPFADGYVCEQGQCDWDLIAFEDFCDGFDGRQYRSVDEMECGLTPSGVALCNWSLSFEGGSFQWQYSDVVESGDYSCAGSTITATTAGGTEYTGEAPGDATFVWEGAVYERVY